VVIVGSNRSASRSASHVEDARTAPSYRVKELFRAGERGTANSDRWEAGMRKVMAEDEKDLHVIGSPELVQTLIVLGLVDELKVSVMPIFGASTCGQTASRTPSLGMRWLGPAGPTTASRNRRMGRWDLAGSRSHRTRVITERSGTPQCRTVTGLSRRHPRRLRQGPARAQGREGRRPRLPWWCRTPRRWRC
jgi:hypothetical protein